MDSDSPSETTSSGGRAPLLALGLLVFLRGFAVMVLEIVGARYLQPWFGGAFYVWTSQIGVVMLALAAGYAVGGQLADRWKKARYLGLLLIPAGVFILLIPAMAPGLLDAIVDRHASESVNTVEIAPDPAVVETNLLADLDPSFLNPDGAKETATDIPQAEEVMEIPAIWRKVDPAIGSAVVFLYPCFVLAMISPYMIRLAASRVKAVGTVSGRVYAASTAGSIGGVFVTAYVLIDHLSNFGIFMFSGGLTLALAGLCFALDRLWPETSLEN